jgi:mannan endo-1,4-beta-mannosidase
MNRLSIFIAVLMILSACTSQRLKDDGEIAASELKQLLVDVSGKHILFGHQDDLAYGIGWKSVEGESDVKRVAGKYPSVFGWEIGNIGDAVNIDGVAFDSIKIFIARAHHLGGINTISWHASNPITNLDSWNLTRIDVGSLLPGETNHKLFKNQLDLVAAFLADLKDENENPIPVIFRPWHEMYGSWFWWGRATCSDADYKKLFRFTVEYLRNDKKLKNLLIAFAPDNGFSSKEEYLQRYPGDDVVDVLGLDDYGDFEQKRLDNVVVRLEIISDIAKEKGKIAAFTEAGNDRLEIENWYTTNLLQVLKATEKTRNIAYVMVWRNSDTTHFFVPYETHPQANDFKDFVNDKMIFLLEESRK